MQVQFRQDGPWHTFNDSDGGGVIREHDGFCIISTRWGLNKVDTLEEAKRTVQEWENEYFPQA